MPRALPKIRSDLIYRPDDQDDSYYYVKDEIRSEFFRFNELHVFVMQALDGKTSVEALIEKVADELDIEVTAPTIESFIGRLHRNLLLDFTSYQVDSERDRELVRRALRKRGLLWRSSPAAAADRTLSEQSILFEEGIRQIERGDPCAAGQYFLDVLSLNPDNQRARDILETIHRAFFRRHVRTPRHLEMVHLFNPDRLLGALDRTFGRWLFTRWSMVGLVALWVVALYPLSQIWPLDLASVTGVDLALSVVLNLCFLFAHEIGHGLACRHYGGRPSDLGALFMYGVIPGAYCDTSDSYLIQDKRQKLVIQGAGMFVTATIIALSFIVYHFTSDAFFLRDALLVTAGFQLFASYQNLIPFVPMDAYYALSDHLRITNLRERSFAYLKARLGHDLLGIPLPDEDPSDRERRIFLWYGTSASLFTFVWVFVLWISVLLPAAIEHLGGFGVAFVVIYAAHLFGVRLIPRVLSFVRTVVRHRRLVFTPRRLAALGVVAAVVTGVLSIRWPLYVDGIARIRSQSVHAVRAGEEGLVEMILVEEGAVVAAGQTIARLVNPELLHEYRQESANLVVAREELLKLKNGARREEIELAHATRQKMRVAARFADAVHRRTDELGRLDVLSNAEAERSEREAERTSADHRIATLSVDLLKAGSTAEEIEQAEAAVLKLEGRVKELSQRLDRLAVTAPADGVVTTPRLSEQKGVRLGRGEFLCEIQDPGSIVIEVEVGSSHLHGTIEAGQQVAARAFADPNREIRGIVELVSPKTTNETLIARVAPIDNPGWILGMGGRARIYGEPRTLAYRLFVVPITRLISYDAWRLLL